MSLISVAEKAGVSKTTVSRVINADPSVTPRMRRRVQAVITQLGYVPPLVRRGPKPNRNAGKDRKPHTVGLLLMGRTSELLEQPSTRRMLAGLTSAAEASGAAVSVIEMPDPAVVPSLVRDLRVDGLLVTGMQPRPEWTDILHPLPFVATGGSLMTETVFDHVLPNNPEAGRLAARYLRSRGCRSVCCLNPDAGHLSLHDRNEACRRQAAEDGLAVRVYESDPEANQDLERGGVPWLRAHLAALVDRMLADGGLPDGLFVPTDEQVSLLHALWRERGVEQVPVTISCNNDTRWLETIQPRPATIDLRTEEIGRLALSRLIARMENPAADFVVSLVAPRLVDGRVGG